MMNIIFRIVGVIIINYKFNIVDVKTTSSYIGGHLNFGKIWIFIFQNFFYSNELKFLELTKMEVEPLRNSLSTQSLSFCCLSPWIHCKVNFCYQYAWIIRQYLSIGFGDPSPEFKKYALSIEYWELVKYVQTTISSANPYYSNQDFSPIANGIYFILSRSILDRYQMRLQRDQVQTNGMEYQFMTSYHVHSVAKVYADLPFYDVKCLCSGGRE